MQADLSLRLELLEPLAQVIDSFSKFKTMLVTFKNERHSLFYQGKQDLLVHQTVLLTGHILRQLIHNAF